MPHTFLILLYKLSDMFPGFQWSWLDIPTMLRWQPGKNSTMHRSWLLQTRQRGSKTTLVASCEGQRCNFGTLQNTRSQSQDFWDQAQCWTTKTMGAVDVIFITLSQNVSLVGKLFVFLLLVKRFKYDSVLKFNVSVWMHYNPTILEKGGVLNPVI